MAGRKQEEPLPIDRQGNGSNIHTLEFDIADAPMLAHAVLIGRNTVMMCAGGKATQRMDYYLQKLMEVCPPGYKHLNREEDLCNIVVAMTQASSWSIWRKKKWENDKEGKTIIKVGDKLWSTWVITNEAHDEVISCLVAVAPMNCEREEAENEIERSW